MRIREEAVGIGTLDVSEPDRLSECTGRARHAAEAAGRDPAELRFGAFVNCVIHPDREVVREVIGSGLSTFAQFSGFQEIREVGFDFERVVSGSRDIPPEVAGVWIPALAKVVGEVGS